MRYPVFRKNTLSGADYQVSAHRRHHRVGGICVGELEAPSRSEAAHLLKLILRTSFHGVDRFFPSPNF